MGRFNDLPKEIVFEILTRLSTQSVLECKLVCKLWRDLVHHPSFSQLHLNHHLNSASDSGKFSFVFLNYEPIIGGYGTLRDEFCYAEYDENCHETLLCRKTRMDLSPPLRKFDYGLVGSCNGLVCFNASLKADKASQYQYVTYICNPITREYIMLPNFEGKYMCAVCTGFGYLLTTNEYKVVRIYKSGGDSNVGIVQVYTIGSGTGWRNAGTMDMDFVRKGAGAFANGALHWVDYEGTRILAFHLADEKFSELPPPPPCLTRDDVPYLTIKLVVLGDFLTAAYYYDVYDCEIWLLKKNKDNNDFSWSKEFRLVTNVGVPLPFEFTKSGNLLYCEHNVIYSYDPKASSAKMSVSFVKSISEAILHKNTLVSLKALGEQDTKTMEFSLRERSSEVIESSATA